MRRLFGVLLDGFPGAFGILSSLLAVILSSIVLCPPWRYWVIGVAVFLFFGQWVEAGKTGQRILKQQSQLDALEADLLERKALAQVAGTKREADELSAAILRFLGRCQDEQPTAAWAYSVAGPTWQRVFFGSAGEHIRRCMKEYDERFRASIADLTARLGGDEEIERLNTSPRPAWPTDVRTISQRLAALGEKKGTG